MAENTERVPEAEANAEAMTKLLTATMMSRLCIGNILLINYK